MAKTTKISVSKQILGDVAGNEEVRDVNVIEGSEDATREEELEAVKEDGQADNLDGDDPAAGTELPADGDGTDAADGADDSTLETDVDEGADAGLDDPVGEGGGEASEAETAGEYPFLNDAGHRTHIVSEKGGKMTVLPNDVAAVYHDNPSFYSYVYDEGVGDRRHVSVMRWANADGTPSGEVIGQRYEAWTGPN